MNLVGLPGAVKRDRTFWLDLDSVKLAYVEPNGIEFCWVFRLGDDFIVRVKNFGVFKEAQVALDKFLLANCKKR